jgi:hypothetical protein
MDLKEMASGSVLALACTYVIALLARIPTRFRAKPHEWVPILILLLAMVILAPIFAGSWVASNRLEKIRNP